MVIIRLCRLAQLAAAVFRVVNLGETLCCPICGERLEVYDTRGRMLRWGDGIWRKLIIRRLRCVGCGKLHNELPDCVVPYKRHCADTIEKIIDGDVKDVPCDKNTTRKIRGWWGSLYVYFQGILAAHREKFGVDCGALTLKVAARITANTHNWVFTCSGVTARPFS